MNQDPKVTLAVAGGGTGYSLLNLPWSEIAALLTATYVALQIIVVAPKAWQTIKRIFKKESA